MKPTRPFKSKGNAYPTEFREESVRYWLSSGQSLKNVAADLGVSPECLRTWRRRMESSTDSTSTSAAPQAGNATELAQAREIGQLKKELEAMTRQRDILKKAISIFSDDKNLNGASNSGGLK